MVYPYIHARNLRKDSQTVELRTMSESKNISEEDPDVPIPHARVEMYWHCEKKGAQLGSLVTMAVAPLVVYWRGGRGMDLLMRTGKATAIGTVSIFFAENDKSDSYTNSA